MLCVYKSQVSREWLSDLLRLAFTKINNDTNNDKMIKKNDNDIFQHMPLSSKPSVVYSELTLLSFLWYVTVSQKTISQIWRKFFTSYMHPAQRIVQKKKKRKKEKQSKSRLLSFLWCDLFFITNISQVWWEYLSCDYHWQSKMEQIVTIIEM